MLRKQVVQKHVNYQEITHIIGHTWNIYVLPLIKMVLFLGCLYVIYSLIQRYFPGNQRVSWFFGGAGLFFYVKGMIDFLNLYLDCMILTPTGIVVFKREGVLEYKTDNFARERIETVSHTQDSIWDKVFSKGNILIALEHGVTYGFKNVGSPLKYANTIIEQKQRYLNNLFDEGETDADKFELLVETLGEVIQDYMGKGRTVSPDTQNFRGDGGFDDY